jgi:uncharacterized protein YdiU (UPF0061 family)
VSFTTAMAPLLDEAGKAELATIVREHDNIIKKTTDAMWRQKLGVGEAVKVGPLVSTLLELMERDEADYTLLWRSLAQVAELKGHGVSESALLQPLQHAFYKPLQEAEAKAWAGPDGWIPRWLTLLEGDGTAAANGMRLASPKFVPREWMLVGAYTKANSGDFTMVEELQSLFTSPYDEQSQDMTDKYYRRAPDVIYSGAGMGGIAYMT